MRVVCCGLDHERCGLSELSRFHLPEDRWIPLMARVRAEGFEEAVLLSTCNRLEVYAAGEVEGGALLRALSSFFEDDLSGRAFLVEGFEAVLRLFEVACGLRSLVLGEDQILGQVKRAHAFAMDFSTSGRVLNRLFLEAISCAKEVKEGFRVCGRPLSSSAAAVSLLSSKMGGLSGRRALVIGLGEIGVLAVRELLEAGVEEVLVTNRSLSRALEVARLSDRIRPVEYSERYRVLPQVDLVISATASPHLVLRASEFPRLPGDLFVVDLAVPRDVEEEVSSLEGVHLFTLEDLRGFGLREEEREELERVRGFVRDRALSFHSWLCALEVEDLARAISSKVEGLSEMAVRHLSRRGEMSRHQLLSARRAVEAALRRAFEPALCRLRGMDGSRRGEAIALLRELFELRGVEDDAHVPSDGGP